MKKIIFGLFLMAAFIGKIFAEDFNPILLEYARSILPGDAIVTAIFPNTQQAADKLLKLRLGEHNWIVDERIIGPSRNQISTGTVDAHKMHGMASIAVKMNSYVRGEAYTIVYSEDLATIIATEITSTIVFAETLRNTKEELRLTKTYNTADGSTGYVVVLWLTAEKAPLDAEVREMTSAISSGNLHIERGTISTEQRIADVHRMPQQANSLSDLVSSVQFLLGSNDRILRFREENKLLLGFDE